MISSRVSSMLIFLILLLEFSHADKVLGTQKEVRKLKETNHADQVQNRILRGYIPKYRPTPEEDTSSSDTSTPEPTTPDTSTSPSPNRPKNTPTTCALGCSYVDSSVFSSLSPPPPPPPPEAQTTDVTKTSNASLNMFMFSYMSWFILPFIFFALFKNFYCYLLFKFGLAGFLSLGLLGGRIFF